MSSISRAGSLPVRAPSRIQQLDVLRGIAILLVLVHHSDGLVRNAGIFGKIYRFFQGFGWTGVDLFFVLSGFLIGGILFREIQRNGRLAVRRFLLRRALKIWPGYLALVLFVLFKESRHPPHPLGLIATARLYWANFFHLQNYFPNIRFHTWSLAVEEHFYLLLTLSLVGLSFASASAVRRWFPPVAVFAIVSIAFVRLVHGILIPFSYETHMYPTHLRLDSLLAGVLIAHLATFSPHQFAKLVDRHRLFLITGIALVVPMFWLDLDRSLFVQTAGFSLLYLGFGCILIGALGFDHCNGLAGRLFVSPAAKLLSGIGVFSYGIYLWHIDLAVRPTLNLLPLLGQHLSPTLTSVAALGCCVTLACVAGIIMTFLIEKPVLALRDRFVPANPRHDQSAQKPDALVVTLYNQAIRKFRQRHGDIPAAGGDQMQPSLRTTTVQNKSSNIDGDH